MATTEAAGGTQAATVTTEHTLTTQAVAGVYSLVVDLSPMVAGDKVELRVKVKSRTGETSKTVLFGRYAHVQAFPVVYSDPVETEVEVAASLKQTAGTGRTFTWSLKKS
jgi:hypothetical protein